MWPKKPKQNRPLSAALRFFVRGGRKGFGPTWLSTHTRTKSINRCAKTNNNYKAKRIARRCLREAAAANPDVPWNDEHTAPPFPVAMLRTPSCAKQGNQNKASASSDWLAHAKHTGDTSLCTGYVLESVATAVDARS